VELCVRDTEIVIHQTYALAALDMQVRLAICLFATATTAT